MLFLVPDRNQNEGGSLVVFQVPASKASIKQNVFEFKLPGSKKTWSIPLVRYISADMLMEMQELTGPLRQVLEDGGKPTPEQATMLAKVQQRIFEHYCPGIYAETSLDQVEAILSAWRDASNPNGADVSLGESSPSA